MSESRIRSKALSEPGLLENLVEMLPGDGITVSLVALRNGLQVAATGGDAETFRPVVVTWKRLEQMRKAARSDADKGKST